jgi:hypothetical protein
MYILYILSLLLLVLLLLLLVLVLLLLQAFIDKFRFNAKRASLVQSRIKALERMAEVEVTGGCCMWETHHGRDALHCIGPGGRQSYRWFEPATILQPSLDLTTLWLAGLQSVLSLLLVQSLCVLVAGGDSRIATCCLVHVQRSILSMCSRSLTLALLVCRPPYWVSMMSTSTTQGDQHCSRISTLAW